VAEAQRLRAEAETAAVNSGPPLVSPQTAVRLNLVVTGAPFSPEPVNAHIDTSGGRFDIGTGHLEGPDVTVSLGYETAKALFVAGNVQAVLQAFLAGQIKVDGDLTKLLDPGTAMWPGALGSLAQPRGQDGQGGGQSAFPYSPLAVVALASRLADITE
jgi:hypothetical protein